MYIQKYRKSSFVSVAIAVCIMLMLVCTTGCLQYRDVVKAIDETNAAVQIMPDSSGKAGAEPWMEPSAKIDAYIEKYAKDDKVTASALRIRQAMLLLSYKQYNLAEASFAQATDLKTGRDLALKALSDDLIWWFKLDKTKAPDKEFDDVIKNFQNEIDKLSSIPENESIRDYLAEMRAWILLYAASKAPNGKTVKKWLDEGLDNYAKTLKPADIEAIKVGKPTAGLGPLDMQIRRQMRAMEVFKRANEIVNKDKDLITGDGASLTFNPSVSELIKIDVN